MSLPRARFKNAFNSKQVELKHRVSRNTLTAFDEAISRKMHVVILPQNSNKMFMVMLWLSLFVALFFDISSKYIVQSWQRMNAWKSDDIWRTEFFDCSGNPEKMTCIWSAMWQDTSWGIGCANGTVEWEWLLLLPVYIAMCVSDPSNSQDKSLMWPMQSTYSRALKCLRKKKRSRLITFLD